MCRCERDQAEHFINFPGQFINLASGSKLRIATSLASCTQDVEAAPEFEIEGRRICLIDTPGFDNTDRSEVEILKDIKIFLKHQCVVF